MGELGVTAGIALAADVRNLSIKNYLLLKNYLLKTSE